VAQFRSLQTGLPPTYEEYLCHKYAMMSRSHTPPPPWSDSTTTSLSNPASSIQARRDLLASQPELREYLTQLTRANRVSHYQQQQRQQSRGATCAALREQQVRAQQRARAMPPRWVVCVRSRARLLRDHSWNNSHCYSGDHMRLRYRRELASPRYFEALKTSSGMKV